ncbi:MAG: dienelactone hydrolase family protein [Chloroflexi bacterium]|nr:dienelactone hydrolase family protein [Chloroflexota bacterium]
MDEEDLSIRILDVATTGKEAKRGGQELLLRTTRGDIYCAFHQSSQPQAGVVWVSGARGNIAGPADGMYGRLAEQFMATGITSLRVGQRQPGVLEEAVMDTLAGVSFLKGLGYARVALVGHSFGGAVVIAAAPFSPEVVAVAALSSQTYGAQQVAQVSPRPLLLVHGELDERLSSECSVLIHQWARDPKELVIMEGAGHALMEVKDQLDALLGRWLADKLPANTRPSAGGELP